MAAEPELAESCPPPAAAPGLPASHPPDVVTAAPGAQERVLEFCDFVAREFQAQSFWFPNNLKTLKHLSLDTILNQN